MSKILGNFVQFTVRYPLQSYYDAAAEVTTPRSMAVLNQPVNEAIVKSTRKAADNQSGYAIALSPDSETPMAFEFEFGEEGATAAVVVRPGETHVPNGGKPFKGFSYGLPFGWLGGGVANFQVFKSPDARLDFSSVPEKVLFHRFRTTILTGVVGAITPPAYVNWPSKFPWNKLNKYALGVTPENQSAEPTMVIKEPEAVLRLNQGATSIAAGNAASIVFWGTDAFGIGADGVTALNTDNLFYDIYWPDNSVVAVGDRNPVIQLPSEIARLASNQWGVSIYAPPGSPLIGMTVDIARYGRL